MHDVKDTDLFIIIYNKVKSGVTKKIIVLFRSVCVCIYNQYNIG